MNTPIQSLTCDVLVVGAGPVGVTLASELMRHGVRCRIIDPSLMSSLTTKALGLQARTLELFEKMGLAETALRHGVKAYGFMLYSEGKRLAHINFEQSLESPYSYILMVPQNVTESLLNEHLAQQGVTVERGVELVDFIQRADGVEAVVRRADGGEEQVSARWLIGCDGAHSTVRHLLKLDFEGTTFEEHFVLADVSLDWEMPNDQVIAFVHEGDAVAYFPMPGGQHRVFIAYKPPIAPQGEVTLEEVQHVIDTCGPRNARASNPTWCSRFRINQRKAQSYRKEHVFLLGDAAHIHSPVAAQGMNTGMQDAFNLAWKLALVINGRASEALLESYEAEREPVGEALLRLTNRISRVVWSHNPVVTMLRDHLVPLISPLPLVQRRFAAAISEVGISYRSSPLVRDYATKHRLAHYGQLHAGDRAPDGLLWCEEDAAPRRLFELLRDTRHVLLVFLGEHSSSENQWRSLCNMYADDYKDVVVAYGVLPGRGAVMKAAGTEYEGDINTVLRHRYGITDTGFVLIRPDGYIGFLSQSMELDPLRAYFAEYFIPSIAACHNGV